MTPFAVSAVSGTSLIEMDFYFISDDVLMYSQSSQNKLRELWERREEPNKSKIFLLKWIFAVFLMTR